MSQKITPKGFEGFIEYKTFDYMSKQDFIAEHAFVKSKDCVSEDHKNFLLMVSMQRKSMELVEKIELKHIKSGLEFTDLKELQQYLEFKDVISELTDIIFEGSSLGNVSKKVLNSKLPGSTKA